MMQKNTNKYSDRQEEFDELVDKLFSDLKLNQWVLLSESASPHLVISDALKQFTALISDPGNFKGTEKELAEIFKVHKWNGKQFGKYTNVLEKEKEYTLISDSKTNFRLLALAKASMLFLAYMNEVAKFFHEHGGKKIEDLFIVRGIENPLIKEHKEELNKYQSDYYGYLVDSFIIHIDKLLDTTTARKQFLDSEIIHFSQLFGKDEPKDGWKYLCTRLHWEPKKAETIFKVRFEIIQGLWHHKINYCFSQNQRQLIANAFAIQDYIEFLKKQSDRIAKGLPITGNKKEGSSKEEDDYRIEILLYTKDELEVDFKELAKKTKTGKQILSEEDVNYWLSAEFKGFPMLAENDRNRELIPDTRIGIIIRFIYKVYRKYDDETLHAEWYREMLKRRISDGKKNKWRNNLKNHFADTPEYYPKNLDI